MTWPGRPMDRGQSPCRANYPISDYPELAEARRRGDREAVEKHARLAGRALLDAAPVQALEERGVEGVGRPLRGG